MELRYADGRSTGLPDESASLVSICLVFHEMWAEGRKEVKGKMCMNVGYNMLQCSLPREAFNGRMSTSNLTVSTISPLYTANQVSFLVPTAAPCFLQLFHAAFASSDDGRSLPHTPSGRVVGYHGDGPLCPGLCKPQRKPGKHLFFTPSRT